MFNSNTQEPVLSPVESAEVCLNSTTVCAEVAGERREGHSARFPAFVVCRSARYALGQQGRVCPAQGLASGSNFILSILLARWLSPEFYGAYAIAFGIYVLLGLIYGALVLEPMSVLGGAAYRHCLRAYCGSLLWTHLAIASVVCLVVGTWAAVIHSLDGEADCLQRCWGSRWPPPLSCCLCLPGAHFTWSYLQVRQPPDRPCTVP